VVVENDKVYKHYKANFINNLNRIDEHDEKNHLGLATFSQEVNAFSHLNFSTLETDYMGAISSLDESESYELPAYEARDFPAFVNWTEKGFVNLPQNQGRCGSCYIFGAIAAIESAIAIKYKKLVKLSEQQYLQCAMRAGNKSGCKGGWDDDIYNHAKTVKGITTITELPYTANQTKDCDLKHPKIPQSVIDSFARLPRKDEDSLKIHLATVGPVSAAFFASPSFGSYKQGIFNDPNNECAGKRTNHIVLIVGYGTDKATGLDYFYVKNSWGQKWGENGYFRIARNQNNLCNIAADVKFPTII
jgi:C1A family cysteine protease